MTERIRLTHHKLGVTAWVYPDEKGEFLNFVRTAKDCRISGGLCIFVPPPPDDDGMYMEPGGSSVLTGPSNSHYRAHLYADANARVIYSFPAIVFAGEQDTVLDLIQTVIKVCGLNLKLVPCQVIRKFWGGRPDEPMGLVMDNPPVGERKVRRIPQGKRARFREIWRHGILATAYINFVREFPSFASKFTSYEQLFSHLANILGPSYVQIVEKHYS